MEEENDYIFRYPLTPSPKETARDPLLELFRQELQSLLSLLVLYHKGKEVKVDGFRMMKERETIHEIFLPADLIPENPPANGCPQEIKNEGFSSWPNISNAHLYEPRLVHIKRVLESILTVVDLESQGKPVAIDGMRLKNLKHWLVPSSGDPAEVFDHLATMCDCQCLFCYLQGNPPSLALSQPKRPAEEEYKEAITRLKYFSPAAKKALFPNLGSPHEVLAYPYALDLLHQLREKTDRPLRLSTNGHNLTPEVVKELSSLKPIYLYLSLNSSSPQRRRLLMGSPKAEMAIRALSLLKERQIPYAVVIVPWPIPSAGEMINDLIETISYADRHDAHLVEISLPGCTKYFPNPPIFDREELWTEVVATVRSLRAQTFTPLVIKPSLFEDNLFAERLNLPWVVGTVKNSPAHHSGIKSGDLILAINGLPVTSRPQARDVFQIHHGQHNSPIFISLERDKQTWNLEINPRHWDYPYHPATDHHLGIIFAGAGFRSSWVEKLKNLIAAHGAHKVLFLSSSLVKPVFTESLKRRPFPREVQIQVRVPENRFFGGNICLGDLLVGEDFIAAIKDYLQEEEPPDLIVIPSSPFALGDWRRDLKGKVWTEIERAVGIPVALLDCEVIYD